MGAAGEWTRRAPAWVPVAMRAAGLAVAVAALATLHLRPRPATLCPVRALTGVPCPFCGGTTAAVDLGRADVGGALAASPLAVALLAGWPFARVLRPPRWWAHVRVRRGAIAAVLVLAEMWQVHRFGL